MEKLKNLTIKGDTMYTLIAYAFKPGNEDLRDSMLTVLYDKDKKAFLNCFKKTEKSSQKGAESISFTLIRKYSQQLIINADKQGANKSREHIAFISGRFSAFLLRNRKPFLRADI